MYVIRYMKFEKYFKYVRAFDTIIMNIIINLVKKFEPI